MDTMQPRRQAFEPFCKSYRTNHLANALAREFKRIQQKVLRHGRSAKVSVKPINN